MKTRDSNRSIPTITFAALALLTACASGEPPSRERAPATEQAPTSVAVSPAAVDVERAERLIDRGGDLAEAGALIEEVLATDGLPPEERVAAIVAQSRLFQAEDRHEEAAVVVEDELARRAADRDFPVDRLRDRLRDLLVEEEERPRYVARARKPAPPFARLLGRYFPADDTGRVTIEMFTVGGDRSVRDEVGTFNIAAGLRAEKEEACPLCELNLSVSRSHHSGDWMIIPQMRSRFAEALVVLYYDLEHNRIPDRYASLLPMDLQTLKRDLGAGKSLVAAEDRPGAPPVLLLAAPRSAMIGDLEREVADLDALPTEPRYVEVDSRLRAEEIRAIVRGGWLPEVRGCYEALQASAPDAAGRIVGAFEVDAEGQVTSAEVTTDDAPLEVGSFLGCVQDAAQALTFPAIGATTTVRYPLFFAPE